jgi:hypothetical protein
MFSQVFTLAIDLEIAMLDQQEILAVLSHIQEFPYLNLSANVSIINLSTKLSGW